MGRGRLTREGRERMGDGIDLRTWHPGAETPELEEDSGQRARQAPLTEREQEVVTGIATGATYREIGAELGLSEKTVATYRARASEKLGVRSRAELVRWALERRLV